MKLKTTICAIALCLGSAMTNATPVLGELIGNTDADVYADTGSQAVELTDTSNNQDDVTAFLLFELTAGYAPNNAFGIYSFTSDINGNITLGETLELFSGAQSPLTSTSVHFDLEAGTAMNTATNIVANIGPMFGFYLNNNVDGGGFTWYSHTSLNSDGFDHMLMFDTSDNSVGSLLGSDVVLAWEDLCNTNCSNDGDFDDLIVGVSDVRPVSEPGTLAALGFALAGLGFMRRLKKA